MDGMPFFGPPDVEKLAARRDVEGLIKALGHRSSGIRAGAASALGAIGEAQVVEPLIQALDDDDLNVRLAALRSLEKLDDPLALDALLTSALTSDNRDALAQAVMGLNRKGDPRALEPLVRLVLSGDDWTGDLEKFGEEAVPRLLDAAKDKRAPGRTLVFQTLWKIGDRRAFDTYVEGLGDSAARYTSERGLRGILGSAERAADRAEQDRLFARLEPLLTSDDEWVRQTVTTLFEQFGGESRLSPADRRGQDEVLQAAVGAAEVDPGDYADIKVAGIDELKRIVYEDSDAVRRLAAVEKFISGMEPVEVLVLSEFASKSGDPAVRRRAIERLRERGNQARAVFIIRGELAEQDPNEKWFGELTPEQKQWAAESIVELDH